jgi:hypothetical protein
MVWPEYEMRCCKLCSFQAGNWVFGTGSSVDLSVDISAASVFKKDEGF